VPRRPPVPRRARPSSEIDGVSRATCFALDRLDHRGISARTVAGHLATWRRAAARPARDLHRPFGDELIYVAPPARDHLQEAMDALPARRARELRALVDPVDAVILRRTVNNPRADQGQPWWHGRWSD